MSEKMKLVAQAKTEKLRRLAESTSVELQVRDAAHARSSEVIEFSVNHLAGGGTWAELRFKLGLGPAHSDYRWRLIRNAVAEHLVPKDDEEAKAHYAGQRMYMLQKMEDLIEELDAKLETMSGDKVDRLTQHHYFKMKLDAMRLLMEENYDALEAHVKTQRLKQLDKKVQGPSVLIQNNYHIPRPGEMKGAERVVSIREDILDADYRREQLSTDGEGE